VVTNWFRSEYDHFAGMGTIVRAPEISVASVPISPDKPLGRRRSPAKSSVTRPRRSCLHDHFEATVDHAFSVMRPGMQLSFLFDCPIFIADSISLAVSREKDGKLRIVYAGWDNANVVQPDGYGQARGWTGGSYPPPWGEALTPLKN
jgi:hypothetical protein